MRRSLTLIEVVIALANVALLLLLLFPATLLTREKATRTRCANGLRQLGVSATSYADDKRFFPKVSRPAALDGDWTTSDATKALRALLWYGYFDDPGGLICYESQDRAEPLFQPEVRQDMKLWFWSSPLADGTIRGGPGQGSGNSGLSPFVDGLPDHSLDGTTELSYGWTRKGLNVNVRGIFIHGADRALRDVEPASLASEIGRTRGMRGNHLDGWNLLQTDASVWWISRDGNGGAFGNGAPAAFLTGTRLGEGFMAMYDQRGGW